MYPKIIKKSKKSEPRDPPGSDPQHLDNCENARYPPGLHFEGKSMIFGCEIDDFWSPTGIRNTQIEITNIEMDKISII